MFAMSRKKVWNSIVRRKRKNHLDLSGKEETYSGSFCKLDFLGIELSRVSLLSLACYSRAFQLLVTQFHNFVLVVRSNHAESNKKPA